MPPEYPSFATYLKAQRMERATTLRIELKSRIPRHTASSFVSAHLYLHLHRFISDYLQFVPITHYITMVIP